MKIGACVSFHRAAYTVVAKTPTSVTIRPVGKLFRSDKDLTVLKSEVRVLP
jgi:hypothetical protein